MEEINKNNNKNIRQKLFIFSQEREIILENNVKMWVLFSIEENGEKYIFLTNKKGIFLFRQTKSHILEEVEDEGIVSILSDLLEEFANEFELVDENGESIEHILFEAETVDNLCAN
ncbi:MULTISPECIES: hypothetical protein [unclassified Mycoplasma]|uniref:hypothetical protein n=1 Tax=Mycoplasma sp. 125 TaxID=3447505 RepID=UPI003F656DF5